MCGQSTKRRGKSLRQGILGSRHIARLFGEICDQLAIARPRNFLRRVMGKLTAICRHAPTSHRRGALPSCHDWAPGHFAAQAERCIKIFDFNDVIAGKLFLAFGIGAIQNLGLAVLYAHGGGR